MASLLHRATRDLAPDVEALVAGGLRRGQVRRRRRRIAATAVTVATSMAAVLAVIVASSQLLGPGGVPDRADDPADSAPTAAVSPSPTTSASTPARPAGRIQARLAVTTEQVPTTFASLEPGQVGVPSADSGPDAAPVVDFTWNHFGIRVGITPDDYATGHSVPDPVRRCAEQSGGAPCRPGPDGTAISTSSSTSPAVDGGTVMRSVWVFRPDGWDVLVAAYNGPSRQGPVTADKPPLTLRELEHVATSDVWFR
ncbi:MAG: hypothetical protein ABI776_02200 [Nocardioidaceae bacterium]